MYKRKNSVLDQITPKTFLKEYWQKKPCLIRQAIPGYQCPVSPEELAGLACEEDVSSRLVIEKGGTHPWQVKYGPLTRKDFKKLPETHWTLLVQEVDHYLQEITTLRDHFNFIPSWRIDDVMISYAPKHGSVGPHLDSYDVFLLQGMGKRRWQINAGDYTEADFVPGLELRILKKFRAKQEWILEPGDMLYLPPGVAHHGIALDPCLTLSIGFLAPSRSELITHFVEETISGSPKDSRYADPGLLPRKNPGEITKEDFSRVRELMQSAFKDKKSMDHWFGKFITHRMGSADLKKTRNISSTTFKKLFVKHKVIYRSGDCRSAWYRQNDKLVLFINGESFTFDNDYLPLIKLITGKSVLHYDEIKNLSIKSKAVDFLCKLYNRHIWYFDD
jgi:50S ribosomal protein L16 3-hydroxylase